MDHPDHAVVISVVYDGPPEAGKTTSLRALARSFGREVYTPEESNGRTVHFDWLEHTGGRFEGAPIHCQIVSVPGQKRWVRRRAHFLDRADVVVFVGDTTAGGWPETVTRLDDLRADLDARGGPPVGLVLQANKRDCADAVPLHEVRARASTARVAVIESAASDGTGVREAFVFAVRLALDRVRHELERDGSVRGRPGFGGESGAELFERLRAVDVEPDRAGAPPPGRAAAIDVRAPSEDAPSGFIWPPIEGRILLREAAPSDRSRAELTAGGDIIVHCDGWHIHASAGSVFVDLDDARGMLIDWARAHAAAQAVLSRQRCIVLAETGDGRWRLWQIVRREPTLRELTRLPAVRVEHLLADAAAACAGLGLPVSCTVDTVGADRDRPVYVGLMPQITGSRRAERR